MKIYGVEYKDNSKIMMNKKIINDGKGSFSKEMENSSLNGSSKKLKELLSLIKKKGDNIVVTKSHEDVVEYKNLVKQYLKRVLQDIYELNKFSDTFGSRYYLIVETIDSKLKELTDSIFDNEKSNIDILNTVDEIQGLMIDIYK